jgi:DNA-binding LytR/AlgR family response regulator
MKKQLQQHQVLYIKAAENYCIQVLENGKKIMESRPIKYFENQLFANGWCRIHRSFIVNPYYINQVSENFETIHLKNGHELPISRRKRKEVIQWHNS